MFACFAPSCVMKNNEPKEYFKTSEGSKKGSSRRNRRVKPIDIANPSISDGRKKRSKPGRQVKPTGIAISSALDGSKKRRNKWGLRVKNTDNVSPSTEKDVKDLFLPISKSFPYVEKTSSISPIMATDDSLVRAEQPAGETTYEVGDEHDKIELMKGDQSDSNLQPKVELASHVSNTDLINYVFEKKTETDETNSFQAMNACRHASDSSIEQATFMDSPVLKRSCSNIERKKVKGLVISPRSSSSCNNLENLSENGKVEITHGAISSQSSVLTSQSADRVMQRLPSIEILLSRSHSNPHRFRTPEKLSSVLSDTNKKSPYSSDMHDPDWRFDHNDNKEVELENLWVSSSLGISHMDRVSAWVNSLEQYSFVPVDVEEYCDEFEDEENVDLDQFEIGVSSVQKYSETFHHETEEVAQPNSIIQSLNSFSSVAHISNIGLKVVPSISAFINLRSANLSGNSILQITTGSLPKSLHTLDLSRNKISNIEGLGNLEKLRVLNLSFNRISRIGHGLLSCTLIKELYLAGNKISAVEGLHRVLKLTMLDLSFNKINSTKALGQLVVNYSSLLALNITGNPIQGNIGDGQLKKEVLNLLPRVTYLNKHSIKPHKILEVPTNSMAKATLGDCPRRKITRRLSHGSASSSKRRISEGSSRTIKHRSKSMQSSPGSKSSQ